MKLPLLEMRPVVRTWQNNAVGYEFFFMGG